MLRVMFFFFNDTATTEIYTLSLHDALPIFRRPSRAARRRKKVTRPPTTGQTRGAVTPDTRRSALPGGSDRKSTRLNSSYANISYAVFCLKKKVDGELKIKRLNFSQDYTQYA